MDTVGRSIRFLRHAVGVDQRVVSQAVGRTQAWLGLVENGRRTVRPSDLAQILATPRGLGLDTSIPALGSPLDVLQDLDPRVR